jgi:hypothetical protein
MGSIGSGYERVQISPHLKRKTDGREADRVKSHKGWINRDKSHVTVIVMFPRMR